MLKPRYIIPIIILAGLVLGVWLVNARQQQRKADQALRERIDARLVLAIRRYYLAEERLPESWEDLVRSGYFRMADTDMDAMFELGHNVSGPPNPFREFQNEVFARAIGTATKRQQQWHSEVQMMRKRWQNLDGDLRQQLSLLLDSNFEGLAVVPYLDELCRKRGIPDATMSAFIEAAGKMRISQIFLDHPERAIDHPDFIPITRIRAQEELMQARDDVERLLSEIMEYDRRAATRPTTSPSR